MKKVIIFFIFLLFSCSTFKSVSKKEAETFKESKLKEISDSINTSYINKSIEDKTHLKVTKSKTKDSVFNAAVNEKVDEILKGIDISKKSGENSYRVWYDLNEKKIKVHVKVGETKSTEVSKTDFKNLEKTSIEKIKEEWKKIKIPLWVYLIVVFLFRRQVFSIIGFFFPSIKKIKSFKDVI